MVLLFRHRVSQGRSRCIRLHFTLLVLLPISSNVICSLLSSRSVLAVGITLPSIKSPKAVRNGDRIRYGGVAVKASVDAVLLRPVCCLAASYQYTRKMLIDKGHLASWL